MLIARHCKRNRRFDHCDVGFQPLSSFQLKTLYLRVLLRLVVTKSKVEELVARSY